MGSGSKARLLHPGKQSSPPQLCSHAFISSRLSRPPCATRVFRRCRVAAARFRCEGLGFGLGERQGLCVQNTKEICFRKDFTLRRRESGEEVREGG